MEYRGEIAGLVTAVCWSATSIFFTLGSRRWGALALNRMRLAFAVVFLSGALAAASGSPVPTQVGGREWLLLGVSGIVGLMIGDSFLFHSFTLIGPRKAMLVMSTVPILSGILAWITLGESLSGVQIAGVLITVAAVIAVVAERARGGPAGEERLVFGLVLAFGGAVAQAIALVAAKEGMGETVTGLAGTWIRMVVAMAAMWGIAAVTGDAARTIRTVRDRRGLGYALGGSLFGPFLGVWMSLVAVRYAPVGVASSLMGLVPIFVIPLVMVVFGERVSLRALLGTIAATGGVVLLFLR